LRKKKSPLSKRKRKIFFFLKKICLEKSETEHFYGTPYQLASRTEKSPAGKSEALA
jgi:hypothetical protein